jgi:hypothetical protein
MEYCGTANLAGSSSTDNKFQISLLYRLKTQWYSMTVYEDYNP